MLSLHRIVFPTDFSACAEHAFSHAAWLAAATGAELHALHVRLPSYYGAAEEPETPALVPEAAPEEVRLVQATLAADSAQEGITAYAREHDVDLIVMGTHGRTGVRRLVMGSVAEAVVRTAPCPVMTVPEQASAGPVARILVPVDFSSFAHPALAHAKALAALHGASLDVLHVVQETTVPVAYGLDPVVLATPEVMARTQAALADLVTRVPGPDVPVECHVVGGYAGTEILRFAEERPAGLIVMSTHGATGLEHFLLGSVTEKIVRRARCPVFTVRSFGRSLVDA